MDARTQLLNAQPVNQVSSQLELNALLHVIQDSSEMETMDAENAQTPAHHAHQPVPAHHVLKPEINQLAVFATTVFTHAQPVLHTNNAQPV